MKVLSTEGLTKLIDLIKSNFISSADVETTNEVTLATVATTGAYSDLSGKPTVDQTYDGTSANAQSGVAVASAISGKADDSAVVHIAGTETVDDVKTFTSALTYSGAAGTVLNMRRTDINYSSYVESTKNVYAGFFDANGNFMGGLQSRNTTTATQMKLMVRRQGDTTTEVSGLPSIGISYGTTGDAYGIAPASDVNGSIVTTVTKTKAAAGGFKLGNGLIINWGTTSSGGSDKKTVTFKIPFASTNYFAICNAIRTGSTGSGWGYLSNKTKTTVDLVAGSDSTVWLAIGY